MVACATSTPPLHTAHMLQGMKARLSVYETSALPTEFRAQAPQAELHMLLKLIVITSTKLLEI